MNFYRHNWYYVGIYIFVILTFYMLFFGENHSDIQKILIFSFMSLLVHQFEEYGIPGGFPSIFNIVMNGERKTPDRFPQNANLAMIVNVIMAYPFYLLAVFFPQVIWLGLATIFFGFFQILAHGIMINLQMKSIYNPGLGASLFLHAPIGIYYIWYLISNNLVVTSDYLVGGVAMIAATIVMVLLPIKLLASRETRYPFSEDEMKRFGMEEKVKKLKNRKSLNLFQ